ncbi:hypothetical protein V1499_13250 [Neobacillus sp. SCS-31]|uniref:hypothetical protein n=1 Tax=Neobacillus oceani TaxID=3115292 RepID=UPI003905E875
MKIAAFTIIFRIIFIPLTISAESTQEIDISVSPEKALFNLNNLAPGDEVEGTIKIVNNGKQNFNYLASSKLTSGSELFYNQLLLKIIGENQVIYDGKIKDFEKLIPRFIEKGKIEELLFVIKVPLTLGNEYQTLSSEIEFKFYAEGTFGGTIPPIWVPEPDPPKQDPPKQDPPKQDPPKQEPPSTQPPGDDDPREGEGPGDGGDDEIGEKPVDPGDVDSEEPPAVELPDNETPGGDNGTPVIDIPDETVPTGPGGPLPFTSTSIYNLIIIGAGLIGLGFSLQFYFQRRKKITKNV